MLDRLKIISWTNATLERSSLFCIGFLAYFLASLSDRSLIEWQLGLTMVLGVVVTFLIPVLYIENNRVTDDGHTCIRCQIFDLLSGLAFLVITTGPAFAAWFWGTTNAKLLLFLGAMVTIIIPILYLENARVFGDSINESPEIRDYIHVFIFIGLAIVSGVAGWFGGTTTSPWG